MLKKMAALTLAVSMLFTSNVFAKGAVTLSNQKTGSIVQCSVGDTFVYTEGSSREDSILLGIKVDLTQVGTKRFNVKLDGAEWSSSMVGGNLTYTYNSAKIPYDDNVGISYTRQNDKSLAVKIDGSKVDTANITIKVPLNCVITGSGDIKAYLDGVAFSEAADYITFAASGNTAAETPNVESEDITEAETETEETTKAVTTTTTKATTTTEAATETTTEAATETTTEAAEITEVIAGKSISFVANGDYYYVNGEEIRTDTPAYVSADTGYTMLPIRLFADSFGVSKIEYYRNTKTAVIYTKEGSVISIEAYQNKYTIDGTEVAIDGCAEIQNDRIYLPLRAMVNAFGISSDYIDYDAETKTVTVNLD